MPLRHRSHKTSPLTTELTVGSNKECTLLKHPRNDQVMDVLLVGPQKLLRCTKGVIVTAFDEHKSMGLSTATLPDVVDESHSIQKPEVVQDYLQCNVPFITHTHTQVVTWECGSSWLLLLEGKDHIYVYMALANKTTHFLNKICTSKNSPTTYAIDAIVLGHRFSFALHW